jgi:hypothetical protein
MKKEKKTQKSKKGFDKPKKDINDLIDDLAYLDEKQNIRKSKSFLDDMYLLDE